MGVEFLKEIWDLDMHLLDDMVWVSIIKFKRPISGKGLLAISFSSFYLGSIWYHQV